jgi:hypothetical protein
MQQGAQDIELRLEVVPIPVSDVDAAKAFKGVQLGPEGTPGSRFLFFDDPDGNTWAVQEYRWA